MRHRVSILLPILFIAFHAHAQVVQATIAGLKWSAEISERFTTDRTSSDRGEGFSIIAKGARGRKPAIHLVYLQFTKNFAAVEAFILGKRGILDSSHWRLLGKSRLSQAPWMEEVRFEAEDKSTFGVIWLGEARNRAFYLMLLNDPKKPELNAEVRKILGTLRLH